MLVFAIGVAGNERRVQNSRARVPKPCALKQGAHSCGGSCGWGALGVLLRSSIARPCPSQEHSLVAEEAREKGSADVPLKTAKEIAQTLGLESNYFG